MIMHNPAPSSLLPVVKLALLCVCASIALAVTSGLLCVLPLAVFAGACFIAPFFPQYGFFLPVVIRGRTDTNMVALTFDDGPDPDATPQILNLLSKYNVPATFFVIGEKARRHPELVREIIAKGHAVGNHSYHHDVLLMLRSRQTIAAEIRMAQETLSAFGIKPLIFRPPVGITNPKLGSILKQQGLYCVNFSCRGFDAGNRKINDLAAKILKKVRPGDIILLHDCMPKRPDTADVWLKEVDSLLAGLAERKLAAVSLEQLLGRAVCNRDVDYSSKFGF
jgi:peptidoglycan-N-acetylglucosamine deacetylase